MQNTIDFKQIKLIIWDLDNTFWNGTISEGPIQFLPENNALITKLNDSGIINSICSKNNEDVCKEALESVNLWDEFVFKLVNWEPKGNRIKNIISDMNLRAVNVLFIDDSSSNLEEAKYYCRDLMTAGPEIIPEIITYMNNKNQTPADRTRFNQYKVLERKTEAAKHSASNEDFLRSCNIKVHIDSNCRDNISRIYDILQRTNQLNFTKKRSTMEEIKSLLNDSSVKAGLVSAEDNFGDYGVIGFYAVKDNRLIHYTFSCRTLGMGIEQWIYAELGYPELEETGDVAGTLSNDKKPDWINTSACSLKHGNIDTEPHEKIRVNKSVLLKGPCDLSQLFAYIEETDDFDTEFTYISDKFGDAASYNHTVTILSSLEHKPGDNCLFTEDTLYETNLFKKQYSHIFLSILVDTSWCVYKSKKTGKDVVWGDYLLPLTEKENREFCCSEKGRRIGKEVTLESLQKFADEYESIGLISEQMFVKNLCSIRGHLPSSTKLHFILGSELEFKGKTNPPHLKGRHHIHKKYNDLAKQVAGRYDNTDVFDINEFVTEQSDFRLNQIHYSREVYYKMAKKMSEIISAGNTTIPLKKHIIVHIENLQVGILDHIPKPIWKIGAKVYHAIKK